MKKIIFFFVLFTTLGINAQTPICTVDTTGWKRISYTSIDFNVINSDCKDFYDTNSSLKVWFDTCVKLNDELDLDILNQNKIIDITKYNVIELYYGPNACDINMKYSLFKDRSGQTILLVNLFVPNIRCKGIINTIKTNLFVRKTDCLFKPKLVIIQHQI